MACFYNVTPQGNSQLHVELEKSNFLKEEPIIATFKYSALQTDIRPNLLQDTTVRVSSKNGTSEFSSVTKFVYQGTPEKLPTSTLITSEQNKTTDTSSVRKVYEDSIVIDRTGDLFPVSGQYQVQFFVKDKASELITISISEPSGIDLEAYEELKKYESGNTFNWAWSAENGLKKLEEFVSKYRSSVYGDFASIFLARIYVSKGQFDKARKEFNALQTSIHPTIAADAEKSLKEIDKEKGKRKD